GFDERGRGGFILASVVTMLAHLYEEAALLAPLRGWRVRMGGETVRTVTVSPTLLSVLNRFLAGGFALWTYQQAGYGVWRALPSHFRAEAGATLRLHPL